MADQETAPKKTSRMRRLWQLLALVAVAWAVVALVRRMTPPPSIDIAREAVEQGRFSEAVALYEQHLAKRPEDWGVRTELGLVLAEFDRPQALKEFRQVPEDSEAYPTAQRQIAFICLAGERYQEAEKALFQLIDQAPDDGTLQLMMAEMYFRQGRARAALTYARKSAELLPDNPRPHFLVAELLDDLGRASEMIAPLERALDIQIDNYAAHLNLAYAYAEAGRPADSRREAEWCLARNPADINARRFLAQAARDEGKTEEAQLEIERALALAPNDLECRLLEAELLLFQNQAEQVLQRLRPLYEPYSRDRRLVALLARAAASAGLKKEAEKYRQQVQRLSE